MSDDTPSGTTPTPPTPPPPPPAYPSYPSAPAGPPAGPPTYPTAPGYGTPPPGGYGTYPNPYGDGAKKPSKTMAIVALVLAFVPICLTQIASIVLAIIVLVRSRSGQAAGRGMAIAALVVSTLVIAAGIVLIVIGVNEDSKQDEARKSGSGEITLDRLKAGDCVPTIGTGSVRKIEIVPCSKPHEGEIYADFTVDLDDDATQTEIRDAVTEECTDRFAAFAGIGADQSRLLITYIQPQSGLSFRLNQKAVCVVSENKGTTTGSLQGAKR